MRHIAFPWGLIRPRAAWLGFAVLALMLPGCTNRGTWDGIYTVDRVGRAKTCVVPEALPPDGQTVLATMQVSNEGGWCGITTRRGSVGYDSYLMVTRPAHGRVYAHHVGRDTRIDYTPDAGYVGADHFGVQLIPGGARIESNVSVTR